MIPLGDGGYQLSRRKGKRGPLCILAERPLPGLELLAVLDKQVVSFWSFLHKISGVDHIVAIASHYPKRYDGRFAETNHTLFIEELCYDIP